MNRKKSKRIEETEDPGQWYNHNSYVALKFTEGHVITKRGTRAEEEVYWYIYFILFILFFSCDVWLQLHNHTIKIVQGDDRISYYCLL